jgi:hypothetical protein
VDAIRRIEGLAVLFNAYPALEVLAIMALLASTVLVMPVVLGWLLRTRRLPAGPLRSALEADLARQGIRVGGIEQVDTGGLIANAAYLGLTLRSSRIFITDALLGVMPQDEIRAVFAHEVAHGTRRHLLWILLLFVGLLLVSHVAADYVTGSWAAAFLLALPMIGGLVAFVAISRRFEVEADLVGAESIGDADAFNRALVRVGAIAGKPLDRHGLRHYAIAARTAIVRACALDPAARADWSKRIRGAKLAILALLVLALVAVLLKLPADLRIGRAFRDYFEAVSVREDERQARLRGETPAAEARAATDALVRSRLESAIAGARGFLDDAGVRERAVRIGVNASMALADEALRDGDFGEARRIADDVEGTFPAGDPIGDFNRKMLATELAAIDPARDLASLRPDVVQLLESLHELVGSIGENPSTVLVEEELRFLAAATGVEGASLDYDPDAFESARLLALARGAPLPRSASREEAVRRAFETWEREDFAWRRRVLERALGKPVNELLLVAAETRRGA